MKILTNKNGELNYQNVVIYTILIGFFVAGFVTSISNLTFTSLFYGITGTTILFTLYLVQVLLSISFEFIRFIYSLSEPIRKYIEDFKVTIRIISVKLRSNTDSYIVFNSRIELCVFRC